VSRFSLEAALAECFSSVETAARLKGLDCRLELDGLAGLTIATDRAKFKQILANFLSNALRYTDRGRLRLYGERTPEQIRISVQDSGVGIAPADQARVFDEFATLENPRRKTGEGTGLGLAICRRLAGLLGGEILLQSEEGRGSTFTLVLPTSVLAEPDHVEPPTAPTGEAHGVGAILVAEDHDDSRRTLARVLRRLGYRVVESADGREALRQARAERPMAILMDVNMPGMDGIDATLAIRDDPTLKDLPIFALTGDVSVENQRRIGEAGVQGYLEKPVTAEALKRALASLDHPSG
jgi:CheY-like chemotaxis protein/anti-sigma regulatory factor (Ser/Thr protein kinase)